MQAAFINKFTDKNIVNYLAVMQIICTFNCSRAEQSRAEQSRAEQSRAELSPPIK